MAREIKVKIVGDSKDVERAFAKASASAKSFGATTDKLNSRIHTTRADAMLAQVRAAKAQGEALVVQSQRIGRASDTAGESLAVMGARAGAAGFAIFSLVNGVRELTAKLEQSNGKIGETGRLLDAIFSADPGKFGSALDNLTGNVFERAIDRDLKFFFDLDRAAERTKKKFEEMWEAAHPPRSLSVPSLLAPASGDQTFGITPLEGLHEDLKAKRRKGITRDQRNRFFDSDISRELGRVQDSELQGQLAKLESISAKLTKRLALTKDITRKLRLEDEIADISRQRTGVKDDIAKAAKDQFEASRAHQLDVLQLAVDRTTATKTLTDDLAALTRQRDVLRKMIAADKDNVDLQRQLLSVAQQQSALRVQQRQDRLASITSKQFRELGLDASGNAVTPGVANLRKRLGNFTEAVKGTFLDTSKTESQLSRFRKVLSEALVPKDVRAKFAAMLDDLNQQLKDHVGPETKTTSLNTNRILGDLNLGRDTQKLLESRLAKFNSAGVRIAPQGGQQGGGGTIVVHAPDIFLDGEMISQNTRRSNTVHARRNPKQKRGRRF
jgi:hypothetical protein